MGLELHGVGENYWLGLTFCRSLRRKRIHSFITVFTLIPPNNDNPIKQFGVVKEPVKRRQIFVEVRIQFALG